MEGSAQFWVGVPPDGALYVDAMNVLASSPDGWWHDRVAAFHRLIEQLQPLAAVREGRVVVVVEGRAGEQLPSGPHGEVEVAHASRRGRDAADDRIVELLADPAASRATVVTADRDLRDRATAAGAHVIGPRTLRTATPSD
ncbi:MAG: NYN domain-containing protein [Nitriliruptoraceae bacterium]